MERYLKNLKEVLGERDLTNYYFPFELFTRTFSHQITIKEYNQL